jgi:hypothetical protein
MTNRPLPIRAHGVSKAAPDSRGDIAAKILDYLRHNPDAGDTLEGISNWWLDSERVDHAVDEIACVIEILIENGLLKRIRCDDGTVIYKVTKEA